MTATTSCARTRSVHIDRHLAFYPRVASRARTLEAMPMSYQATENAFAAPAAVRGSERLVLLALAYHADPLGRNSFPSVATIAAKARVSERTAQYPLRRLERRGL